MPQQYKVLIVEDDDNTAFLESATLRKLDLSVEVVNDGSLAIQKMREWKPEVVVLDLELPGKNGYQILQEMFLDGELRNLIIIANTIHMDGKDELGFSYYCHYRQIKQKEPVMVNKLDQSGTQPEDLPYIIGHMIGEKYGAVPKVLGAYLEDREKNKEKWSA